MAKQVNRVDKALRARKAEVNDKFSSIEEALGVKLRPRTDSKGNHSGKKKSGDRRSVFDNPNLITDINQAVQVMRRHPTLKLLPDGDFEAAPFESVEDVNIADNDVKLRRLEAFSIAGALAEETKWFEQREAWLMKTKIMLWCIVPLIALCLASSWWFTGIISTIWWIPMFTFLPTYTRVGGMMSDMHPANIVYATVATVGFFCAALLVGSQTGVEIGRLTSACDPSYEDPNTVTSSPNTTASMSRTECLEISNAQGPSSLLDCKDTSLYPLVSLGTGVGTGVEDGSFLGSAADLAADLTDSLVNAGDTLTSFYDITSDVGKCSAERIIMNFGLLAYTGICITLAIYFAKLLKNFRLRAGDMIEKALIHKGPVDELLAEAVDGSPDISRAAVLKISALIASATKEYAFDEDDRPNEFGDLELLDELREANCAEVLCKLAHSVDPVIRMHTAEAIERFVHEPQCMQSFIEGSSLATAAGAHSGLQCIMHLLTESCAILQEGEKNYTLKNTAKFATEALLIILIHDRTESVAGAVFEETESLTKLGSGIARGMFSTETNGHLLGIFIFLLHETQNAQEHREKSNAHEAVCEVLTALVIHCDADEQLVQAMQCVLAMYDVETTSAVRRSYVRAMMAMPHSRLEVGVRKLVVELLLKAASGGGPVAEYLITFEQKLVVVLKETINTEYVEFVRAAVMVVHELTHCDTSMGHLVEDLENLLDHALVIDSAHEDIRRAVDESKARLRDQASDLIGQQDF